MEKIKTQRANNENHVQFYELNSLSCIWYIFFEREGGKLRKNNVFVL